MRIKVLDAATLGEDISFDCLRAVGDVTIFQNTDLARCPEQAADADCIIVNKVKMNRETLRCAIDLRSSNRL